MIAYSTSLFDVPLWYSLPLAGVLYGVGILLDWRSRR